MTPPPSRRQFLGAACVGAILAGGCSSARTGRPAELPPTPPPYENDLDAASGLGRLEKLAAETYAEISLRTTEGTLGALIPPALTQLVGVATSQHLAAFDEWNRVLGAGGHRLVGARDEVLGPVVDGAAARVADVIAACGLLLGVEDYLGQAYQRALPRLRDGSVITLAARITVVGHQRQAVLRLLTGRYPVGSGTSAAPMDFAPADPRASLLWG